MNPISRRGFLRASAATAGAAALTGGANLAMGQASSTLKIGLIGCGGRGTGAAGDCLRSSPGVKLVAMADAFRDRLDSSRARLSKMGKDKVDVPDDKCFVGLDAYKKLIATDVDMVLLTTPPGFRPFHLEAAIAAGKHVFMEKPVAVDPAGIRLVIEASHAATEKKLGIVAGTQRRHQASYVETMKRIHDGAIGEIVSAQCYWNMGTLWTHARKPEYSDVEWQMRNWLYFTYLSGDHICEQHVHNLDVVNWGFKDITPEKVLGMGGRQARKGTIHGNIYDHHTVEFEYPGGVRTISMCRQTKGASHRVSERIVGTKGVMPHAGKLTRHNGDEIWSHKGKNVNPYVQEHADLIASIRAGKPLNEGARIAQSTMCAIIGRMATYTGREFKYDWALKKSKLELITRDLKFGPRPVAPVAIPGKTQLI